MSPAEKEARQMIADKKFQDENTEAYDSASNGIGRIRSKAKSKAEMPSKYSSVRSNDFEKNVDQEKIDAVKQGLRGAGKMAKQAGLAAIPGGALMGDVHEVNRGAKMAKGAVGKFQAASEKEDAADRELNSQLRRESRGVEYKKGGSVSASRRADGIAQRGKTKGRVC
jgi:hypothetical protein